MRVSLDQGDARPAAFDLQREHIPLDAAESTYYIGHQTIIAKDGGLQRVPEAIFSYLNRNAVHVEMRYGMPTQQVVEIGTQIRL